ncbi:MAG: hypothetical protein AAGI34_07455 [Pseudomonadota bacterium]
MAQFQKPECKSVELFRPPQVKRPAKDVPEDFARWYGAWGGGVWNGTWCHDLIVLSVAADGAVEVLDMHAPSPEYNRPATIFKRRGRIQPDGSLRFRHGVVQRHYELHDGVVHGLRQGDSFSGGALRVVMSRKPVNDMVVFK